MLLLALLQTAALEAAPLAAPSPAGETLFERLPAARTGLAFRSDFDWEDERRHLFVHGYAGGGVAIGDYDGDGAPDLFLTGQLRRDALYRQAGDLRFEETTDAAGILGRDWGTGASFVDVDRDGDLDLSACNYGAPNRLYVNQGDGTFTEEAAARGLAFSGASIQTAFADHDLDGDLDAYLVTYREYTALGRAPRTRRVAGRIELAPGEEELFRLQERVVSGERQKFIVQAGQRDRLYRNDAGRFTDVTAESGIEDTAPGFAATWWDYDGDLLPDLYVCNDFWDADRLYHNEGGGRFRDVLLEAVPHTPWFSMGADAGDLDGDGLLDLVAADMSATTHFMSKVMMGEMGESRWFLETAEPRQYMRNAVYLNTGTGRFGEVAHLTGLASTDWTWSILLEDLDADGRLDVFATNGTANHTFDADHTRRLRALQADQDRRRVRDPEQRADEYWRVYLEEPPRAERNLAFRNRGDLRFAEVGAAWGLDLEGLSFGAQAADLDRDGDLDLVVSNVGDEVALYRNGSPRPGLLVRLRGRSSHPDGLGARLELRAGGALQVREPKAARGYLSGGEPLAFFGLGDLDRADELTVAWPSGHRQSFADLAAGALHTITEPEGPPPAAAAAEAPAPLFEALDLPGLDHVSVERPFDDYAAQPLLPQRLSRLGPGLAWGDADGDGLDDLFVGGPAGQAGTLLRRAANGFERVAGPWEGDAECEDLGALWLDHDRDGDLDLVVASGGVEAGEGDALLADRLYENLGGGAFRRAEDALPDTRTSTGALAAGDVDGDGDLDLFVGGRVRPGRYPLAPTSALLRNEDGRFVDATAELAPGLADAGLVTSALFSDADGDGRPDLLVAREWGPVGYWHNVGGRLEERTRAAGLSGRSGWWSSLLGADLDADGALDYVALNAGLNTKYHATPAEPTRLHYGDFDGSGEPAIVEAKGAGAAELPVRGLSCSSERMPFVRERFPTFRGFASAVLEDIYPEEALAEALLLEADHLESGVWMQRPGGGLAYTPLPRLAQASPGYGVGACDFDADGHLDLAIAQNFFHREPETGRWDGGLGLVLRGTGGGALEAVRADASGVVVPGDQTALTVADLDLDGRPDLLLAQNGGPLVALRNATGADFLSVRLAGPPGNPTGVGARVTFLSELGPRTHEIGAGSGYLSQAPPVAWFADPRRGERRVRVAWPGGARSEHVLEPGQRAVLLPAP